MSSTQNTSSPRPPKVRAPHVKKEGQSPAKNVNKNQRRPKSDRVPNGQRNGGVAKDKHAPPQDSNLTDNVAFSSEDAAYHLAPCHPKGHMRSQPSVDRPGLSNPIAIPASRDTTGYPAIIGTPVKEQTAYAGPTFHASPAPSTLPIPKFLSKSVPAKTRTSPPTPPIEASDSDSPNPSPSRAAIPIPSRQIGSPLDMLFKADQAERARGNNNRPGIGPHQSPSRPSSYAGPQNARTESYGSLNAPFPIELDGEHRPVSIPLQSLSPGPSRSITAPSKLLQTASTAQQDESGAIADLLNRLSVSHQKSSNLTPPKTANPLAHGSSFQSPPSPFYDNGSPIRSASNPSTPASTPQDGPDYFYGNRNLSPLFKQAKMDGSKRNSGLRTEVTADSPVLGSGPFPIAVPSKTNVQFPVEAPSRGTHGPDSPVHLRPGSAPQVQHSQSAQRPQSHPVPPTQPRAMYSNHRGRGNPKQHYNARPRSTHNATSPNIQASEPRLASSPPSKPGNIMAFVPSSVRAKPKTITPPKKVQSDSATLEQDLKRLLNLTAVGSSNGSG